MLKRIKIRGKLLLLLLTPLVAVVLFASSGVIDRRDDAVNSSREARLAEFAETTGNLSTALQIERFQSSIADRLSANSTELRPDEVATDESFARWLDTSVAVQGDVTDQVLIEQIASARASALATIDPDRGNRLTAAELGGQLKDLAETLNDVLVATNSEATSVELFSALDASQALLTIQEELVEIASIGDRAIAEGEVSQVTPVLVASAVGNISAAYDEVYSTVGSEQQAELAQLLTDNHLPVLVGSSTAIEGGFDPTTELARLSSADRAQALIEWTTDNEERLTALNGVLDAILTGTAAEAALTADAAQTEATQFLILAVGVILFALGMAIIVGRSVSRPLTQLTNTAWRLSSEELPAMVESMRSGGRTPPPTMTPIRARGTDEVAQLSEAFSEIQSVTVEVAEEQGNLLRRGISDIFVNLARRNQSLLDRQIDFIDQLESREENPDQLENLFRLDHLATRMRRNAESLLVLAGADPARRRGQPVELTDVIRVAMGEIEDFGRIRLSSIDPATVAGSVAVDMAHLLSELMENATQFSPPDTDVVVVGRRDPSGAFELRVADKGIGMSAEQLLSANQTLAEPPVIGLELSRSLGFTVVSGLANRLGVDVELSSPSVGGVVAAVTIPAEMVGDVEYTPTPLPSQELPQEAFAPRVSSSNESTQPTAQSTQPTAQSTQPTAQSTQPTAESAASTGLFESVTGTAPAPEPAEPVNTTTSEEGVTSAGLTRRTPRRAAPEHATTSTAPSDGHTAVAAGSRSPEEVRQMLSRYRSGLKQGRGPVPSDAPTDIPEESS